MKNRRIFLICIGLIFLIGTVEPKCFANDPFNTYQFNRTNYLRRNGKEDDQPWFEWWYYKVVLPEKNKSYYFVYGVVNPWDRSQIPQYSTTRAYVSMGDFSSAKLIEQQFKANEFNASYHSTEIQVGASHSKILNQATDKRLIGSIESTTGDTSQWNISIERKWTFNATGSATGKNLTSIEWYPAQADARCSGEVIVNGQVEVFENAPCYQDRNWGSQFPEWWAWVVSNHFENSPDTTLVIGGGKPTLFNFYKDLQGVTIGFKYQGKEYNWLPYDVPFIKFNINYGHWEIEADKPNVRIKISARAPKEKFMDLQFVTPQGPTFHDYEALQGDLDVELYERKTPIEPWHLKAHLQSHHAGLEFGSYHVFSNTELHQLQLCLSGCLTNTF